MFKLNAFGVHYVDKDATGANNGTSWQDAYTNLQDALAAAQQDDHIWVAEGTYLPGQSDTSTFLIEKDIQLYGGFAGTETNLLQRDWAAHPTILSGDVNGDDVVNSFTANRSDNVNNILQITAAVTNAMVLDGFTVQGGHADENSPGAPDVKLGGGLWSVGSPTLRNCTFRQNYANDGGAGAFFYETQAAVSVQNCIFDANKVKESIFFGGALVVYVSSGVQQVKDCVFQNNFTGSLAIAAANAEISNCQFLNNKNYGEGAGLLANIQTDSGFVWVKDCQFAGNVSGQLGAGILGYCVSPNNHLMVTDCTFEGNRVNGLSIGGGMAAIASSENDNIEILRCAFKGNVADEGGGLLVQATFLGQPAPGATDLNVTIEACIFEENQAPDMNPNIITGGGGICFLNIPGSENINMNIDSCQFIRNTSDDFGGGLTIYDETGDASYSVSNSLFSQNTALDAGGITFITYGAAAAKLNLTSSILENNDGGLAGGLRIWNERPWNSPVKDSIFIETCLVAENAGVSTAGGISVNATAEVFLFESTVAGNDNTGLYLGGGAVAQLRNTILHNPGSLNVETVGNEATANSNGGVLSGDASADAFLGASDLSGTDPQFLGSGTYPYQLSSSSPAIDAAVPFAGAPALDLAGNARVQGAKMDIGAYESPFFSDIKTRLDGQSKLSVSPNPVANEARVLLENDWHGELHLQVVNAQGPVVFERTNMKDAKEWNSVFDFAGLVAGNYHLLVRNGERLAVGSFVKQ